MPRCEHQDCIAPGHSHCHASCCTGDVRLCDRHGVEHHEQYLLDVLGYGAGYFRDQHQDVLSIVRYALIAGRRGEWPEVK